MYKDSVEYKDFGIRIVFKSGGVTDGTGKIIFCDIFVSEKFKEVH
jgi:hypothetical protein